MVSLEELFKGSPNALAASPGLKARGIHAASAPTLKNAGAKVRVPRVRARVTVRPTLKNAGAKVRTGEP